MFTRACGVDMSFRDVTIETPDRKCDRGMWMTSCTRSVCGGFWGFEKKSEWSSSIQRRRLTFGAHQGLTVGAARGGGEADRKVVIERLCLSLPHDEKPFNSKVIKSFVPELRSRKVFRASWFLCYLYMSYKHSMSISHIPVWLRNTFMETFLIF